MDYSNLLPMWEILWTMLREVRVSKWHDKKWDDRKVAEKLGFKYPTFNQYETWRLTVRINDAMKILQFYWLSEIDSEHLILSSVANASIEKMSDLSKKRFVNSIAVNNWVNNAVSLWDNNQWDLIQGTQNKSKYTINVPSINSMNNS